MPILIASCNICAYCSNNLPIRENVPRENKKSFKQGGGEGVQDIRL